MLFRFLTAATILSAAMAHAADKKDEPKTVEIDKSITSREAFEKHVSEAGGRVDFVFGDDRPFAQCHASSIEQAPNGDLICVWFAGTKEKHPDVGIWGARFTGGEWTAPERIVKVDETAHWNPVLFRHEDTVHLYFKIGPEIPFWQTYTMTSTDNGKTWSEARELVPGDKGGRGPVRSKPIVLSDGSWLAGASTEYKGWKPFADRSEDGGKTWTRSEDFKVDRKVLKGAGAIQPTLWESEPGHVHALLRAQNGFVWRADSTDYGHTWPDVYATDIPNNNSGIDLLDLEDGRLLLVYNPVGVNWGPRTPLDLAVSTDNGKTFTAIAHLEDDSDADSEFSYPGIIRTKDGVAISYTWQRERVRVWQIPMAALAMPETPSAE